MTTRQVQVYIKSVDKTTFSLYLALIKKTLTYLNIHFSMFCLPKKNKRFSILKSPHVNKKAIEQFEIKYLKAVLTLKLNFTDLENKIIKNILINKPRSIELKIKRMV